QRDWTGTVWERLSDCLPNLLEHLGLGFEKFVIISLRQQQRRFVRLLNDPDTVLCRKGRDELDRFCDVRRLASEGAVTSKETGRIDAIRPQRPNPLDIGLLLKRGDALKAVRIADAADRIVLGAEAIKTFAKRLDAFRDEVCN